MNLGNEKELVRQLRIEKSLSDEQFAEIAAKYAHLIDVYPLQFLYAIKTDLYQMETPPQVDVLDFT